MEKKVRKRREIKNPIKDSPKEKPKRNDPPTYRCTKEKIEKRLPEPNPDKEITDPPAKRKLN